MKRKRHNGRLTRTRYNGNGQEQLMPYCTVGQHRNNPRGLYTPTMRDTLYQLARFGHSNKEIAEILSIGVSTLENWKLKKPEVRQAIEDGRTWYGLHLLDSLDRRAHGYEYQEVQSTYATVWDKKTERWVEIEKERRVTKKHVLPNVTALIYLLKVRYGDKYSDVLKAQLEANVNLTMHQRPDVSTLTPEQQEWLRKISIKQLTSMRDDRNN